jgi:hypothetical protein
VDEWVVLAGKDGPKTPRDSDTPRKIAFGRGERVGCCGTLEEEERKEDEDLGPDVRGVSGGVDAECCERGEEDEDSGPAVPEREWEMNEEFIGQGLRSVELLHDVVDVLDE